MPPSKIKMNLEGIGWDLLSLHFGSPLEVSIDATNQFGNRLSEQALRLKIEEKLRGEKISITSLDYQNIDLRFENATSKRVPVRLHASLKFEAEHQLRKAPSISPDSVTITGPSSVVDSLVFWPTDSLIREGLKSDETLSQPLLPPDNKSLKLNPTKVEVLLPVELFVEKDFFVPVQVNQVQDSFIIIPYPRIVKLTAVVGMSRFNELEADDFMLEANMEGIEIRSEKDLAPLEITAAPDYVKNIRLAQQSARFTFALKDSLDVPPNPPN